ncbi:hypothetical protein [Ralstonia sp. UBA689]|uniref:hypothetical protein n=1 Tax=Ralstonia sp. UBA689 TaxID=1947373 RepID=UPI0025E485FF|nr:hypothetical protein [Ralstonia sp. UBA689]
MKRLLLTALCLSSATAFANDQVLLETPITYLPEAGVVQSVKDECQIESMLARRVGDVLRKIEKTDNVTIAAGTSAGEAKVLRLQISHVLGVGGGAWTGPKAITVVASLVDGGKVVRQTKINRWTLGGLWGGFKGTCSILERSAIAIGKDLGRWVRNPSYVIKNEDPPAEAASAPAAETTADTKEQ